MPVPFDLDSYSRRAEEFVSEMDREYYLHFSGRKERFEIESIYERNRELSSVEAIESLRQALEQAEAGDEQRRRRYLLQLAVDIHLGQACKAEAAEYAALESKLELDLDGKAIPYRQAPVEQANAADPARRGTLESARLALLEEQLNPLSVEMLERVHERSRELGWRSYREMYEQLKAVDLDELNTQTASFMATTEASYAETVEPALVRQLGAGLEQLRRSDMPRFFRAPAFDAMFDADDLVPSFERTLSGLGIDPHGQPNVSLDLESRPNKSPRAFCAPIRVPAEVRLVIPRAGGREDYAALFHEGGHTEHYANVDAGLAFEFRHLGDNSVTESFAFLFEHLTEDPVWLQSVLGIEAADGYLELLRASKLIFLRRYAAKLDYELKLHGGAPLDEMPALYSRLLGGAVQIEWPAVTYLSDVDDGFYVANYLRAWALETSWRSLLNERYGDRWFERREAGDFLRSLWAEGQRLNADELLESITGERLDFGVMLAEV